MSNARHPIVYEKSDADPRLIVALALGIAVFLVATPFVLLAGYSRAIGDGALPPPLPQPPAPRLQADPRRDLDQLRSHERQQLDSFGWIDRERGIVRIPLELAMQRLAARGLSGWPSTSPAAQPHTPLPH